ncbi:ankyrin repeat-containing protein At5g02620 [Ricinus communis]|uniref:Ankyrin repeat-containing protein, putative n=1 Tax=Ricinus communis TaxID=3988 RepID=B9SG92_RICCO|nr:ankyrin repeat-containing protein At5g02620 [Ricinus communis]EEF37338.1 ankyrin repeat-containing protein, putative [Ricinus communis]|eukprot:XP_015578358.1 ankyrin repeat-containing protein At5g02620 [Ricinus communis]
MDGPARQTSFRRSKMTKQLTGKRDDSPFHAAARAGNLETVLEIVSETDEAELKELLSKQNQSGETALYVAAEYGHVELVKEMIKYYDIGLAGIKARNGYDAFHIAAKQGDLKTLTVLMEANPELAMTFDSSNTTALHSAASQGHVEVVNFLLEKGSSNLVTIAKSNSKTALHSAARNGHLEILRALLIKEPGIATRIDRKGQTALHMAVKGQNVELVDELIMSETCLINMVDSKGNTPLHIAARKGRTQIVKKLLEHKGLDKIAINRSGETAFDTAEKTGQSEVASVLEEHGVQSARSMKPGTTTTARELKQTVSDIKHEVHDQIQTTRQTRKRVQGIAKRLNKMHTEGLNNAINSTTVVAVLIATVAFAAIYQVPGQFADNPEHLALGQSAGEANAASKPEFMIFIIFDSIALFISLAVVVVQTSIVVIERKAKKQLMAVINKLMWLACVLISIAFLALAYVVVGDQEKWLALWVTGIGTVIMAATIGTMCYWVIMQKIESSQLRRSSISRSLSGSMSVMAETEILENEHKKLYAI